MTTVLEESAESWRTLARHQVGSVLSTAVDFGVMTILVQFAHIDPVPATALGAACGALTNFTLGRRWIFRQGDELPHAPPWREEALRYAVVSGTSLLLNTAGEFVLVHLLGVMYVAARAVIAVAVSLLWNYPMQRAFVFGARGTKKTP